MAWYYELLGKDDEVLETSEPVYASQIEAQYAGYQRIKAKPSLSGPLPISGKAESRKQITQFPNGGPPHQSKAEKRLNPTAQQKLIRIARAAGISVRGCCCMTVAISD